MRIHLGALGCRLNEAELERWATAFEQAGDAVVERAGDADLLVLNTCAVTAEAVRKSRRRLQALQRENPLAKLVVSGCYSSLAAPGELEALGVDLVVANRDKERLVERARALFAEPAMPAAATRPGSATLFRRHRHRAFVKVQDGCRHRCSFCIVTVARGEERSRAATDIVTEVRELVDGGVREIVLTGVHVGGYGRDLGLTLPELVQRLLDHTAIERLRFASIEPWELGDPFFALFDDQRVQPHVHLPLQSGSDGVLRRMARRCRRDGFRALVARLRAVRDQFNVTTDIIAGFPGESDSEWRETLEFVASLEFGHVHAFTYSERAGTRAAALPDPVPMALRRARTRELQALAAHSREGVLRRAIGRTVPVLWEGTLRGSDGYRAAGYTPDYLRVIGTWPDDPSNRILPVRLVDVVDGRLVGVPASATRPTQPRATAPTFPA